MQEVLHSFGVRHLRSFGEHSPAIPIKPINILVGRNSCGKSTFLRTFPLLRQSVQADTKSPILWFGSLVDFGDFDTALHDGGGKEISFEFNTTLEVVKDDGWDFEFEVEESDASAKDRFFDVTICISISRLNDSQLRTKLLFDVGSSCVEIVYTGNDIERAVAYNRKHDVKVSFPLKVITDHGALIPITLRGLREVKRDGLSFSPKRFSLVNTLRQDATRMLADYFETLHHASKSKIKIRDAVESIKLRPKLDLLQEIEGAFPRDRFFLKNLALHKETVEDVTFTLLVAREFNAFLKAADGLFKSFFSGVRYQAPLRAAGERFYRYQDLRVDEVDHTGSNLPMVINSLDANSQKNLSNWILENFGFELLLSANGLHYEIQVREEGDKNFHNVSDMGFGYSQILPVIVSIWLEFVAHFKRRPFGLNRSKGPRVIVLEQPELHLHPALQYKFGLAIAKVISRVHRADLYFVIETHSKHLIDALGESIRNEVIDESIVNIALFEKKDNGVTSTSISGFDSEGYLFNWPAGFLSPDYDN
ncbi:TPA: AAA family ATPase [Pseudomonas putida]|uniref:AAA family ATPase n=1 Tax=Pseudomonas putida TaxID=303 RepID=UPI00110D084A|nr:AAA family ATPase [Pseudomonas putida]HDS0919446.1 AAA family ATPase [Pseudomonas putida]HDS3800168.1 AAA family ATPase [Pseudomonas putida]